MPSRIEDALNFPVVKEVVQVAGDAEVRKYIEFELIKLANLVSVGGNLNNAQVVFIAQELIATFPNETLADFKLCFHRGAIGQYGEIFRLDGIVIRGWMGKYLDEKYIVVEAEHAKLKHAEADTAKQIDYKAYIERREKEMQQSVENPKAPDNWKANELERFKLDYLNSPEYQERKAFQQKLQRASSEFYKDFDDFGKLKVFEDEKGFQVFALNDQDAERIYKSVPKEV